jgi:hypothetical protein
MKGKPVIRLFVAAPTVALVLLTSSGCVNVKHQLDQSKPLEINVNIRLIDDRLEDFYAFEQRFRNGGAAAPATQPAPAATQPASS